MEDLCPKNLADIWNNNAHKQKNNTSFSFMLK